MAKNVGIVFKLKDECTPQINKIAEKFKVTTQEAKKLQSQAISLGKEIKKNVQSVAKFSALAVTGIVGGLTIVCNKTREYADRVDDMSKKIGISKKAFQEWEYIIKQNGAEIDVVQRGMKTLVTQALNVTTGNKESIKSFKKLGISVKDANGNLKTQEILFDEVITKLQLLPNGLEKSALATKLLGKAGIELQPLLEENAKTISDLKKEINDLGLIMDDKTIDSANTFSDNLYAIQRGLGVVMFSLGSDLIPTLNEFSRTIVDNMPKIRKTVIPVITTISNVVITAIKNIDKLTALAIGLTSAFALFRAIDVTIKIVAFAKSLQVVIPLMTTCKAMVLAFSTATKIAQASMLAFNVVMNANPIVLLCSGIALAVVTLSTLELKFKLVTRAVNKFKQVSKGIYKQFADHNAHRRAVRNGEEIPKYATGTSFASGGLSLVGEKGPELIDLPRGSRVYNAKKTQAIGNRNITINLNVAGNVIGNREFITQIKQVLGRELAIALNC